MKIAHINYHAASGGAATAVKRLDIALKKYCNIDSKMVVIDANGRNNVNLLCSEKKRKFLHLQQALLWRIYRLERSPNYSGHTWNIFPNNLVGNILALNADIVHLHSIVGEMLSIKEIAELCRRTRVVWTFHDAWAYTGTEQYYLPGAQPRYKLGYTRENKESSGLDIDRFCWNKKRKYWRDLRCNIISPSHYLAREIRESVLFKDNSPTVIHHGIDLDIFSPSEQTAACHSLGITPSERYIGAAAADFANPVKGGNALAAMPEQLPDGFKILVAGHLGGNLANCPNVVVLGTLPLEKMPDFYRACAVFVNPTRNESFGLTNLEAMACGTPVVTGTGGALPEVVKHNFGGILCDIGSLNALVEGINTILASREQYALNARAHTIDNFSDKDMAERHLELYQQLLHTK